MDFFFSELTTRLNSLMGRTSHLWEMVWTLFSSVCGDWKSPP